MKAMISVHSSFWLPQRAHTHKKWKTEWTVAVLQVLQPEHDKQVGGHSWTADQLGHSSFPMSHCLQVKGR